MNNQTMKRIKESLVSSNTLDALGSDSCTVSTLSVRGHNSEDESDLLNAVNFKDDSEFLAEASFAGDADENIMDPCAVCFTDRNFPKKATHFCDDCGLLGHFLCEQCLGFHKKFTNHKSVKSFAAAKYKRGSSAQKATDTKKQSNVDRGDENKKESQQKQTEIEFKELKNENNKLKEENIRLQNDNAELKKDVLEVNRKVKKLQNEISHAKSEASNHDEVLQQKASEIDALREKNEELSSKLKNFEEIKTQLQNTKKFIHLSLLDNL